MKRIAALLLAAVIAVTAAGALAGCSNKITVTIFDRGEEIEVDTDAGTTVKELLDSENITLGDRDEVKPPKDIELSKDTPHVKVSRYARVTVIKGKKEKQVELTGGRVRDAVEESGFELKDGYEPDADPDSYLEDGMVIRITKEITVTLSADGKSGDYKTRTFTVGDFLKERQIVLAKDDEVNKDMDAELKDGMKITVKRVTYKEEEVTKKTDFKTKEQKDSSMYEGETKTIQEGKKGEKLIKYRVKYVDGKEAGKEKISETTIKKPVDMIVAVGTKKRSPYKDYEDDWISVNDDGSVTVVEIEEVEDDSVIFEIHIYDPDGDEIASSDEIYGEVGNGNRIEFVFYSDDWGNRATGTLIFDGDTLHLTIRCDTIFARGGWRISGSWDLHRE